MALTWPETRSPRSGALCRAPLAREIAANGWESEGGVG